MAPYPRLTTYPSLGELSVASSDQKEFTFVAILEWNLVRPNYPFQVVLCYTLDRADTHASRWNQAQFRLVDDLLNSSNVEAHRKTFLVTLTRHELLGEDVKDGKITFTVKYRSTWNAPWNWTEVQQGHSPGELLIPSDHAPQSFDLANVIDLQPGWNITTIDGPENQIARVYSVTLARDRAKVGIVDNEEALYTEVLGSITGFHAYMAVTRLEPYWIGVRQGKTYFHLDEEALMCCFLLSSGLILTIATVTGPDDTYSVLSSSEDGAVAVSARSDSVTTVHNAIVAISNDLETSIQVVMDRARAIVTDSTPVAQLIDRVRQITIPASTSVNEWLDGLMYCTWNGIGQDLTEEKLLTALRRLEENDINISALLIDDNWQTLGETSHDYRDSFYRGFADMKANSAIAPEGLPALLTKIRLAHPRITDIGCWHALMGYWAGIADNSPLSEAYATSLTKSYLMGNIPADIRSITESDLHRFYDDLYKYLSSCGMTFVKTDVQHMLAMFRTAKDRRGLIMAYQSAWTTAYNKHFSSRAISCMSQTPYTIWSSLLQSETPRICVRNSDDFYPEIPASHPWHVWVNAHNALFTQHLNATADWDMFQTAHEWSKYHAAARCLSGGPIMITDVPGEHDLQLIEQITALDYSGRRVALRPSAGKTLRAFDGYKKNGSGVLRIGTTTIGGASLVGLFNVRDHAVDTIFNVDDFPGLPKRDNYARLIRFWTSGSFHLIHRDSHDQQSLQLSRRLLYASLPATAGFEIITAYPILTSITMAPFSRIAVIGLVDKISGAAAVTGVQTSQSGIEVSLRALGRFALWFEAEATSKVSQLKVTINYKLVEDIEKTLEYPDERSQILYIDILAAWRRLDLWKSNVKHILVAVESYPGQHGT